MNYIHSIRSYIPFLWCHTHNTRLLGAAVCEIGRGVDIVAEGNTKPGVGPISASAKAGHRHTVLHEDGFVNLAHGAATHNFKVSVWAVHKDRVAVRKTAPLRGQVHHALSTLQGLQDVAIARVGGGCRARSLTLSTTQLALRIRRTTLTRHGQGWSGGDESKELKGGKLHVLVGRVVLQARDKRISETGSFGVRKHRVHRQCYSP
jgi:hypothetical protein